MVVYHQQKQWYVRVLTAWKLGIMREVFMVCEICGSHGRDLENVVFYEMTSLIC
jgi:hypothetical protein